MAAFSFVCLFGWLFVVVYVLFCCFFPLGVVLSRERCSVLSEYEAVRRRRFGVARDDGQNIQSEIFKAELL